MNRKLTKEEKFELNRDANTRHRTGDKPVTSISFPLEIYQGLLTHAYNANMDLRDFVVHLADCYLKAMKKGWN